MADRSIQRIVILLASLAMAGCSMLPSGKERSSPPSSVSVPPMATSASQLQCLSRLGATQASFVPLSDRYYGGGCSTLSSVSITRLQGDAGEFELTNLGPVSCPLAESFAAWARFGVDRAARQILGSPLVRVETMGSYSCRNVAGSGRLSAHARAEAIDVGAFVLADGRRISLVNDWNGGASERRFLRVVHESACKRFGTVLGPSYNAAHRDHLHLELGDGTFCR